MKVSRFKPSGEGNCADAGCSVERSQYGIPRLLCCIVDAPDAVKIDTVPDGVATVFRVSVAQSDIGKVSDFQGRNARALRVLLNAAGAKQGRKFALDIADKFDDLS